jgi:hypothetical protein
MTTLERREKSRQNHVTNRHSGVACPPDAKPPPFRLRWQPVDQYLEPCRGTPFNL